MQHVALVIRQDGTVPIDEGHPHRDVILAALAATGREISHDQNCAHQHGHVCSCSPKIVGWDASKGLGAQA